MSQEEDAYHALCAYTLSRRDAAFIHQHVVDAFAAQNFQSGGKPIGITFALIGLYLLVEHHYSGKQVQQIHMKLGRTKQVWPEFILPENRGRMTAIDVLAAPEGAQRDRAIHAWCASVWKAFVENREAVVDLLLEHKILPPTDSSRQSRAQCAEMFSARSASPRCPPSSATIPV